MKQIEEVAVTQADEETQSNRVSDFREFVCCLFSKDAPAWKLKYKLLTLDTDGDGRTDRGNNICPSHHSSNGGGITTTFKNE